MRKPTTSSEDARHWVLCFTLFHLVSPCKWHRMTSLSIENWQTLWCIGMYQLRTSTEHSLFDGLTWHCLVGSMWGTWKTIWKSQTIHTFPPKRARKFRHHRSREFQFNFLTCLFSSKTLKFQPFPELFGSLCRSPPAFPTFFPAFGVQTADTLRVFGKFLPDLGLMIPVLSIQVTIAHCSSKNKLHQGLLLLTASDAASAPSRILSPSVSHSFPILGRLTPLSPLPTCNLFDVAPKNPRKVSNLKVRF